MELGSRYCKFLCSALSIKHQSDLPNPLRLLLPAEGSKDAAQDAASGEARSQQDSPPTGSPGGAPSGPPGEPEGGPSGGGDSAPAEEGGDVPEGANGSGPPPAWNRSYSGGPFWGQGMLGGVKGVGRLEMTTIPQTT